MAFRNVVIESGARLSLHRDQLVIKTEREASIAIEDLDTLLIESSQTVLSVALLSALAQNGVTVFVCDGKHLPCALLLPYCQHSRQLQVFESQLALTAPAKKRAWQQIVTEKINNQARCLHFMGKHEAAGELFAMAKTVRSGDEGHVEGFAAARYFPALFGAGFTRSDEDDVRNAALNYGYAIIRGCLARNLTTYGFITAIGLNHRSALNQFNLADDFIEPFRPVVDLYVAGSVAPDQSELAKEVRRDLLNLLNCDLLVDNKRYSVSYAVELCVQSFVSLCAGRAKTLKLPELIPLAQHEYE